MKKASENKFNRRKRLAVAVVAALAVALTAPVAVAGTDVQAAVEAEVFGNAIESLAKNTISMAQDLASGEYDDEPEVVISTADKFGYGLGLSPADEP